MVDKQVRLIGDLDRNVKRHFNINKVLKGAEIILYEIDDYLSSKPYYEGVIIFDNDEREEARFFKFNEGNVAKQIFHTALKMNNDGILRPVFLGHHEDGNWILCYKRFECLLSDDSAHLFMLNDDNLKRSIRNSMNTVNYEVNKSFPNLWNQLHRYL